MFVSLVTYNSSGTAIYMEVMPASYFIFGGIFYATNTGK